MCGSRALSVVRSSDRAYTCMHPPWSALRACLSSPRATETSSIWRAALPPFFFIFSPVVSPAYVVCIALEGTAVEFRSTRGSRREDPLSLALICMHFLQTPTQSSVRMTPTPPPRRVRRGHNGLERVVSCISTAHRDHHANPYFLAIRTSAARRL